MRLLTDKKFWLACLVLSMIAAVIVGHSRNAANRAPRNLATLPPVILWAWEKPEKLNFIDPSKVGVAFLAKTIQLRGDQIVIHPRLQSLEVPSATKLIAVVRVETDAQLRPQFTPQQLTKTVSALTDCVRAGVLALQIDFDATASERDFYRQLLTELRQKLPANLPVSITALASWCSGDRWLRDLPIDEAVPMMFRLGVQTKQFASRFESGYEFAAEQCQSSAGVSTDEALSPPKVQRLYIFNPEPWSKTSLDKYLEAYK